MIRDNGEAAHNPRVFPGEENTLRRPSENLIMDAEPE